MKRQIFILALLLLVQFAFAVAIERVTANSVRFYNFSSGNFDMTGMHLTINNNVFLINNLTIKKSGPLDVPPGERIEFEGLVLPAMASIALWYPNAFPNNQNAGNIASFMQYGSAGQPYEVIAVQASLWVTGEFVPGAPPFIRDGDYTMYGAGNWVQGLTATEYLTDNSISVYPNPFSNRITLTDLSEGITYAQIIDGQGKICFHTNGSGNNDLYLNTEHLKKGIYVFRLQLESGRWISQKIIRK